MRQQEEQLDGEEYETTRTTEMHHPDKTTKAPPRLGMCVTLGRYSARPVAGAASCESHTHTLFHQSSPQLVSEMAEPGASQSVSRPVARGSSRRRRVSVASNLIGHWNFHTSDAGKDSLLVAPKWPSATTACGYLF